jgi:hypothetical protein
MGSRFCHQAPLAPLSLGEDGEESGADIAPLVDFASRAKRNALKRCMLFTAASWRPFLLQGVFDFGLSPLMALDLALCDFALISIKHNRPSITTRRRVRPSI